jgi:hypothetical protein
MGSGSSCQVRPQIST